MSRVYRIAAIVLGLWLLVWIHLSWPASIDDALIHLRYAAFLWQNHILSYDGVHRSYGSSSLLYVSLLAALRSVTLSPVLPRAVSSVADILLFAAIAIGLDRSMGKRKPGKPALWLLAIAFLVVLVSPSAVRWLNDGLETSLTLLFVAVGLWLLRRVLHHGRHPRWPLVFAFFLFGFFTELLRVELLLFAGLLSLLAALETWPILRREPSLRARLRHAPAILAPLAGALAGALLIVACMHSLLPDTALAKSMGPGEWRGTLIATAITTAGSYSFGLGLCALWVLSLTALNVFRRRVQLADLAANALFPIVLFLAAVRGQQVQGIRYFAWTLLFPTLWNLLRSADAETRPASNSTHALTYAGAALLALLLAALPLEARILHRVLSQRGQTLRVMNSEHLDLLQDQRGLAEDVGFIGYFTRAQICDPDGLVNGRAAALLSHDQRYAACIAQQPSFIYGNLSFLQRAAESIDLSQWVLCGQYRFDNIRTEDVHYLVASPRIAALACKATGESPRPISSATQ